jgi:HD-GYP domain-containing protein (c-di-GMP phosphodiesterase class II)
MKQQDPDSINLHTYTQALSVAMSYRDLMTQRHSERVQALSNVIGMALGLPQNELNDLRIAASFHDIGKIGIPDYILLKPAQFDEAELEVMRQHPEIGEKIMAATKLEGSQQAARIIRHHHECYDGTGYPDSLAGDDIPICARIISIADNYDAMAVARTYHHAKPHSEIMAIMKEETGKKHDPELMQVFRDVIEFSEYKSAQA